MAEQVIELNDLCEQTPLPPTGIIETNGEIQRVMKSGNPSNKTGNKKPKCCFDKNANESGQAGQCKCHGSEQVPHSKSPVYESSDEDEDLVSDADYSSNCKFDNERIWEAIAMMVIIDGLPFSSVQRIGFKNFIAAALPPTFQHPSLSNIVRCSFEIYADLKAKLKNLFKNENPRVSLTTEKWASLQGFSYTCLTAHWIDDNWKLQKRVLNFLPIDIDNDSALGHTIAKCLLDWGIGKVFSVTVDNATGDDNSIESLRTSLKKLGANVLDGGCLHMRCVADLVNMIVSDCLNEISSSVAAVGAAIRYVQFSPARRKFRVCAEINNIESKKELCLDVPNRWNTTFLMLDTAEKYETAFISYESKYSNFRKDLLSEENPHGVPNASDWVSVRKMVKLLKLFYEMTVNTHGNLHATSSTFFAELSTVDSVLQEWKNSEDIELSSLAVKVKSKWDKYWGDLIENNKTVFISAVLDPTQKLGFVQYLFIQYYGETQGRKLAEMVKEATYEFFNEYKRLNSLQLFKKNSGSASTKSEQLASFAGQHVRKQSRLMMAFQKFMSETGDNVQKSELDKYLAEDTIIANEQFDILHWWKDNQSRFPVLSEMARDVLAVPISTLTLESAFTIGGRVLDASRDNLPPRLLEAVICAQDWLRDRSSCKRSASIDEDSDDPDEMENGSSASIDEYFEDFESPDEMENGTIVESRLKL